MAEEKKADNVVVTPIGFISYPYLAKSDTGRPNSSNKYGAQLFISVDEFKRTGKALAEAILAQGAILKGRPVGFGEFKHTLKMVDQMTPEEKAKLPESVRSGYIRIGTASTRMPIVKGPVANTVLSIEEIARISGGDECRFVVAAYTYKQQGGGVALGLNCVQFKGKGPVAFGSGQTGVDLLGDLEVTLEDPTAGLTGTASAPAAAPVAKVPNGLDALRM